MYKQNEQNQERQRTEFQKKSNFACSENTTFDIEIGKRDNRKLPRSMVYMETICASDLLSKQDEVIISKIRDSIGVDATDELSSMTFDELEKEMEEIIDDEVSEKGKLEKVICRCFIDGCDCHEITPLGKIKEHFKLEQSLPDRLITCRNYLGSHPDCAFIEVYSDCLIAINKDSTAIQI